jgi:hypothetical protein
MSAAGAGNPSFTLQFRVRINQSRAPAAPDRSEFGSAALRWHSNRLPQRQIPGFGSLAAFSRLARGLLYLDRLRNVLLPPRETFLLDRRVQERKGLHALFFWAACERAPHAARNAF